MEPRETETRLAAPAAVASTQTNTHATNTDTSASNNGHNAAATYSQSTLGLIPASSWQGAAPQASKDIANRESGSENGGSKDEDKDANSSTAGATNGTSSSSLASRQPQSQLPSPSHQRYTPQFSAATSLILNRIKGGDKDFNSALSAASATTPRPDKDAFEEAKLRLMEQMNASRPSLPTPEPSTTTQSQTLPKQDGKSEDSAMRGTKRKREANEDGEDSAAKQPVDFTQNTIPFPFQPSPPPGFATAVSGVHCIKCSLSSSIATNMLVTCTRCNTVCHQACLTLSPGTEQNNGGVAQPLSLCPRCGTTSPSQSLEDGQVPSDFLRRKQKIERIRQMRLAGLPEGVVPDKPELVGFGPGAASDRARADYFSNMTKTEVLNLLSFCDQLRPQLLVDIMVSVSKRHPDLLIFNSPDWNTSASRSTASSSKAAQAARKANVPAGRPPHGRSLLNSKAKQKIKPGTIPARQPGVNKRPPRRAQLVTGGTVEAVAAADEGDVDEDAPPPTWPKAGEGLYVKLAPEINDRLFLADENDEEAFSHFMVDKIGRQIIDPV